MMNHFYSGRRTISTLPGMLLDPGMQSSWVAAAAVRTPGPVTTLNA